MKRENLLRLARFLARHAKRQRTALTWAEALAAAPWRRDYPREFEGAFRRAFATQMVFLGKARA